MALGLVRFVSLVDSFESPSKAFGDAASVCVIPDPLYMSS